MCKEVTVDKLRGTLEQIAGAVALGSDYEKDGVGYDAPVSALDAFEKIARLVSEVCEIPTPYLREDWVADVPAIRIAEED